MSTILSSADLNDFIAPGVACIKPVEVEKTKETAEIAIGDDGRPMEDGAALNQAQISLQDCLACSGCITSSEAMLVELQSPKEMLSQLEQSKNQKIFIASVCHQTRVSLAKSLNLPIETIDSKLNWLFIEKLGFECVLGTEIGRVISLQESWSEITELRSGKKRPVLSSICPGWTLYAEKTHPEVIPYLSTVKSPQQLTGRLAKALVAKEKKIATSDIYHVSLMPCFDKKLESSRPDFQFEDSGREVDLVITARELMDMLINTLELKFDDLGLLDPSKVKYPKGWPSQDQFKSNMGSSSGGYLDFVLQKALSEAGEGAELKSEVGKNRDSVEYSVFANGQTVFKGAQVYGFRNIQNLVRKLKMNNKPGKVQVKTKKSLSVMELNYVELMACPGGCVNGGGQIGATENVPVQIWTQEMDALYQAIPKLDLTDDLADNYLISMGEKRSDLWMRAEHQPIVPDTSLPAALTVGTQW